MSTDAWHVYIIQCTTQSGRVTIHVGIAQDVERRIKQHQAGKVRATRGRYILLLGTKGPMPHGEALRREARLKRKPAKDKRLIAEVWAMDSRSTA